jgi:ribosomal-protein-alanine N-acetyltransferase
LRTLRTERLLLRPYSLADLEQLSIILTDKDAMRYVYMGAPVPLHECEQFAHEHLSGDEIERPGFGTVFHPGWNRVIGFAGLSGCAYLGQEDYEIAVVLKKFADGPEAKGLGTEMATRLIRHGLDELKLPRLLASIHPDNIGSIVLFSRLGMKFVGFQSGLNDRGPRIIYSCPTPAADLPRHQRVVAISTDASPTGHA